MLNTFFQHLICTHLAIRLFELTIVENGEKDNNEVLIFLHNSFHFTLKEASVYSGSTLNPIHFFH